MIDPALALCVITVGLIGIIVIGIYSWMYMFPIDELDPAFYATEEFDI